MENKIRRLLMSIGIDPALSGYEYLVDAVGICYQDRKYLRQITKMLYPCIAQKNNTTPTKVERAIRVVINNASNLCPKIYEILILPPSVEKGAYTNSQFIGACVEYLRMER